jgi:hypothetical protein
VAAVADQEMSRVPLARSNRKPMGQVTLYPVMIYEDMDVADPIQARASEKIKNAGGNSFQPGFVGSIVILGECREQLVRRDVIDSPEGHWARPRYRRLDESYRARLERGNSQRDQVPLGEKGTQRSRIDRHRSGRRWAVTTVADLDLYTDVSGWGIEEFDVASGNDKVLALLGQGACHDTISRTCH